MTETSKETHVEKYDRYRKEMESWRDANLVNKKYYDDIDEEMNERLTPTIGGAVNVMMLKGNRAYVDGYPEMDPKSREKQFRRDPSLAHEVAHITARIGHTPQQEMFLIAFQLGFSRGASGALADPKGLIKSLDFVSDKYGSLSKAYLRDKNYEVPIANKRQQAIYLAAGMYLRQKVDLFNSFGLPTKPYSLQKEFVEKYSHSEPDKEQFGVPSLEFLMQPTQLLYEQTAYGLIKISEKEWSAIAAVATGLQEPKNTKYEKRLAPIKEALENASLRHDMKQWAEHASQNPNRGGGLLDPEKFKAARERRGAAIRE